MSDGYEFWNEDVVVKNGLRTEVVVNGPDASGDYELCLIQDREQIDTYLSQEQADRLIEVLSRGRKQ